MFAKKKLNSGPIQAVTHANKGKLCVLFLFRGNNSNNFRISNRWNNFLYSLCTNLLCDMVQAPSLGFNRPPHVIYGCCILKKMFHCISGAVTLSLLHSMIGKHIFFNTLHIILTYDIGKNSPNGVFLTISWYVKLSLKTFTNFWENSDLRSYFVNKLMYKDD